MGSAANMVPLKFRFAEFRFAEYLRAHRATPWLIFLVALAIYLSTGQKLASGDAIPSSLIPITVLLHGTTRLDGFTPALKEQWNNQLPYSLVQTRRGVMSLPPVATGLLATPILALPILAIASTRSPTFDQWLSYAHRLQFLAAAVFTSASAALFWLICATLGFGFWFRLGLTAFYAFGSEAFCTSSQVLWQHGPGVLFILVALLNVIRLDLAPQKGSTERQRAIALSLAVAVAIAVRPTNVLLVAPLFALALSKQPRLAAALTLPGSILGAALIVYNIYYFGNVFGGYGEYATTHHTFTRDFAQVGLDFAGLLFSPGRGLFFYFPFAAVATIAVVTRPSLLREPLPAALAFSILSTVILFSFDLEWTAGWSVGPRYLTEVQPLILILGGMAWRSLSAAATRPLSIFCFGVLLPYSIFVQSAGSYSLGPLMWNSDYGNDLPRAVWYFRDNPIARAWR